MKTLVRCSLILPLLVSCALAREITVFAASSLTEAFEEVAAAFEREHPGVEVVLAFGGSSTLSAQILQGAPTDVFASADEARMRAVVEAGLVRGTPETFAHNRLVVIAPASGEVAGLEDLAQPGVLLALASPEVPAGAYARKVLGRLNGAFGANFSARVLANLVSEEPNVRQVAAKVELGEADAALVYATDAAVAEGVKRIGIPEAYNVVASYPIAALTGTELAGAFVDFVLSETGQRILAEHGFLP